MCLVARLVRQCASRWQKAVGPVFAPPAAAGHALTRRRCDVGKGAIEGRSGPQAIRRRPCPVHDIGRRINDDLHPRNRLRPMGELPALALCLAVVLSNAAAAQGVVKAVHGDWQVRCDTPPGAQGEQCALVQSVTAEDRPNVGLTVIVLKTADQKSRLLARAGAARRTAALRPRPQDRQCRHRPRGVRALPAERLRRRGRDGRQPGQPSCAPAPRRPSSSSRRPKKASASR